MTNNDKTPAIRFKGFTDDWEQRKVGELCSISTGKSNTQDKNDDGIYPFYVRSPIIEKSNKYLYDEEAVITVGDGVGTGKVFHYVNGKYDLHQRCYRMYGFSDELDAKYFYHTFSLLFYKRVMAMTAKTSVDSVRLEMISDMEIPTPNIDEQLKIGQLFTNIDSLITLHQRKSDKLIQFKAAMLQKMFPQNGADKPEIRFRGFTDAWEQRKLGDHSEIVAGGTPNTGHPEYWNPKEIPWMSSGEINNKVIYSTDNMISKIGFSNSSAKWVKEKSVLIALAGQGKTRGTVAISEIPLTTNQSIAAIQPDSFLYYKFLFQNLEGRYNELREVSSGDGTRGGLNKQIISDLEVLAPEIQEQIKIGDFLCGIDNLITLHQRKCEKYKSIKSGLIKKLFP